MSNERLSQLIRMVAEMDRHVPADDLPVAPAWRHHRSAVWGALAAAAALAFAFLVPPINRPDHRAMAAAPIGVQLEYRPAHTVGHTARIDAFEACSPEMTYASVLFRVYDEDCQCLTWRLHQFEDGASQCLLHPGEMLQFTLDVTHTPPVAQVAMLVVASRRDVLPATTDEAEELLACLNNSLPPTGLGDQPVCCSAPVGDCLPPGVALLERQFIVD